MELVNLAHGGVNVTLAKLKRVRISEMVDVVLNVLVVDLAGRLTMKVITRKG